MEASNPQAQRAREPEPATGGGWEAREARSLTRPVTCAERGVVAPFTAPALFGVRVRASPLGGLEVVVPSPSGREGWFVLPWSTALERVQPSLADRMLVQLLGGACPTPASLHAAALHVAAQGLAGRAARRAAVALARRGPSPPAARHARLETFLAELARLRQEAVSAPDRRLAEGLEMHLGAALTAAADQPAAAAPASETPGAGFLGAGSRGAQDVGAARRDWLLDGWELLACGWCVAPAEERPAMLRRAAALAPPVPVEAEGWAGGAALAAAGSPRGGALGGSIAQDVAEAAFAGWLDA